MKALVPSLEEELREAESSAVYERILRDALKERLEAAERSHGVFLDAATEGLDFEKIADMLDSFADDAVVLMEAVQFYIEGLSKRV